MVQNKTSNIFESSLKDILDFIYIHQLQVLHNVHFTRREIEIIACLMNGRPPKGIGALLSLSPRTIEVHIYNIFKKLEVNSKESLITLIEKTSHIFTLKKFYLYLSWLKEFEKNLEIIARLPFHKGAVQIVGWKEDISDRAYFLKALEETLKQAGFITSLVIIDEPFPNIKFQKNQPIQSLIYFLPIQTLKGLFSTKEQKEFLSASSSYSLISVYLLEEGILPSPYLSVECKHYLNRNALFLDIIKLIANHADITKITESFIAHTQSIESPPFFSSTIPSRKNKSVLSSWLSIKGFSYSLLGALGISLAGFYFIKGFYHGPLKQRHKIEIQSELPIPTPAFFLERPVLMVHMHKSLKGQKGIQTIALIGMGGMGKTTLARHYARIYKESLVWELNAETPENLSRSFETLAESLIHTEEDKIFLQQIKDIKEDYKRLEKMVGFVKHRLKQHPHWILIYDNVEQFSDIKYYFPYDATLWGPGKVILTTRNSNIQNCLYINAHLQIPALNPEEREDLFSKVHSSSKEQTLEERKDLKVFLEQVPPFPLDVTLAAQYLKNTKASYNEYLGALYHDEANLSQSHKEILTSSQNYHQTRYSIIKLSIEKMLQKHPDFKDFLILLTLIDSQAIPKFLFEGYKSKDLVNTFIQDLHHYSLISYNTSSQGLATFSIHRSTQEMMRAYLLKKLNLTLNDPRLYILSEFLEKFIYDTVLEEDFAKIRKLMNHGEALLKHTNLLTDEQRGYLGCQVSGFYLLLNIYSKATETLNKSLKLLKNAKKIKPECLKIDLRKANILVYRGIVKKCLGEYKAALSDVQAGLEIYRTLFPTHYMRLSWTLEHLGDVSLYLGHYKDGVNYLKESVALLKNYMPKDDLRISTSLIKLGKAYVENGDYLLAKNSLEESYHIQTQKILKKHYRLISWNLGFLGKVYKALGYYEKAQELFQQGKKLHQIHLPDNHDDIAWFSLHIGNLLTEMGSYHEAEIMLKEALGECQKYLPPQHSSIFLAKYYLGILYCGTGRQNLAKKNLQESLKNYERIYGTHHIETARILRALACLYMAQDQLETAENLLFRSLSIFKLSSHPEQFMDYELLADLYRKKAQGKGPLQSSFFLKKAEQNLQQAISLGKVSYGEKTPHLLRVLAKLEFFKKH
ncbi:hypothetical protein IM40_10715 (plasmid) [Candidatus Paracaedimonas acanthamoebae]|nr:hypothetical protein IM40_10715 [Candidatus Paracaedimonas acanthamoebae]